MFTRLCLPGIIALCLGAKGFSQSADTRNYAKEPLVVQNMVTQVTFSQDGARTWQQTLSLRVQSEGILRQFGVLSFPYASASEEVILDYLRVVKPDGSVVATPISSVVDTAEEIATSAPTYSDLRQKQIPVKALEVGDVLEYSVRSVQAKPEVPGQFWYQQSFVNDSVVLNESLTISVPKETRLQIASPKLKYDTQNTSGLRVYVWKYSQLESADTQAKKRQTEGIVPPSVSVSTFKNWEEVGDWWRSLAAPQAEVTPAIREKAKELTAGLTSDTEKARALYKYVSMKYRYVSISFGVGRYCPHTAEDVQSNHYGDCKDKHTLFAALLKAVGIEVWPALIGAGINFDPTIASPSQFNHVISVLPEDGKYIWLDTTQEVAPFGLLNQAIRDEQALVIPANAKPFLLKTPADPPFRTTDVVDVKCSLGEDGSLSGHFDIRMEGDEASELRSGFRQLAPVQWQALAQQISNSMSYAGEVSGVELENLNDLDKPFHYTYEYKRTKYSDWEEARIAPPLPPMGFGPGDEAEKPKDPFWAGAPGELIYRATVRLPKGLIVDLPQNVSLTSEFADYSARYSFQDGTFSATRTMIIKHSKVTLDQWSSYQKFAKALRTDQAQLMMVGKEDDKGETEVRPSIFKSPTSTADPFLLVEQARAAGENYGDILDLTRKANAIWKKNGDKPAEYAESMVMFSVAKLADDYETNGTDTNQQSILVQWKGESAQLLAEAVDLCRANQGTKPALLAEALELQALQAPDEASAKTLREQAGQIRAKLVEEIMPPPVHLSSSGSEQRREDVKVQSPTLEHKVEPVYTPAARALRISGTVRLVIVIEPDGTPSSAQLLQGLGFGLDERATEAVKSWRFKPGTLDGKAVRVRATVEVTFKLL